MAKKIGIIGAGGMLQYHAAGFQEAGAELHAICDMNQDAAKKAANAYDVPNIFADSQKMLEELQVMWMEMARMISSWGPTGMMMVAAVLGRPI